MNNKLKKIIFGTLIFIPLTLFQNCNKKLDSTESSETKLNSTVNTLSIEKKGTLSGTVALDFSSTQNGSFSKDSGIDSIITPSGPPAVCFSKCQSPYCAKLFILTDKQIQPTTVFCQAELEFKSQTNQYTYQFNIENISSLFGQVFIVKANIPPMEEFNDEQMRYNIGYLLQKDQVKNLSIESSLESLILQTVFKKNLEAGLEEKVSPIGILKQIQDRYYFSRLANYFVFRELFYDKKTNLKQTLPWILSKTFLELQNQISNKSELIVSDLAQIDPRGEDSQILLDTPIQFETTELNNLSVNFMSTVDTDQDGTPNLRDCDINNPNIYQLKSYLIKEPHLDCGVTEHVFCIGDESKFVKAKKAIIATQKCI